MPPRRPPPDVVDLLSDSDDITSASNQRHATRSLNRGGNRDRPLVIPDSSENSARAAPSVPWLPGRMHGKMDPITGKVKRHRIPDNQESCERGCSLDPFEIDDDHDPSNPPLNGEQTRDHAAAGADSPVRSRGSSNRVIITQSTASRDQGSQSANTSGVGFNLIESDTNLPDNHGCITADTENVDRTSDESYTEYGSEMEEGRHTASAPTSHAPGIASPGPHHATSLLQRSRNCKGKGKEREPESVPDAPGQTVFSRGNMRDLPSQPDHPWTVEAEAEVDAIDADLTDDEDLRRAIALSLRDQSPFNAAEGSASASSSSSSSASPVMVKRTTDNTARSRNGGQIQNENANANAKAGNDLERRHMPKGSRSNNKVGQSISIDLDLDLDQDQVESEGESESDATTLSPSPPKQSTPDEVAVSAAAPAPTVPASNTSHMSTLSSAFSLVGIGRKQMEEERLARLKRKRETANDQESKMARVKQSEPQSQPQSRVTVSPPSLRRDSRSATVQAPSLSATPVRRTEPASISSSGPIDCYPEGKAFKTRIAGYAQDDTIDFATLISPASSLDSCLLSSFVWDMDWLFPHFETRRTKFQLVMHAKAAAQRESLAADFEGVPNVRLCFPPMDGIVNCMHSKLMILFYKGKDTALDDDGTDNQEQRLPRCRIVIPTANLVGFDWGVGGIMENTAWLIDLPLKPSGTALASFTARSATRGLGGETQFETSLKAFLTAQTVPGDVLAKLDQFDFRRTTRLGFVHTIGGVHTGQAWKATGLYGLSRVVSQLGLAARGPVQMDYVTSSIGSLNDEFMSIMQRAAQGDDHLTEHTSNALAQPRQAGQACGRSNSDWKDNFRFYFPSSATVQRSKGGTHNAGTLCFSAKWWQGGKFPRPNMRDCVSVREGLLMHNKVRRTASYQDGQLPW